MARVGWGLVAAGLVMLGAGAATGAPEPTPSPAAPWLGLTEAQRAEAGALAGEYMQFLREAKIPVTRVRSLRALAEKAGFHAYTPGSPWQPGARYYLTHHDRAMVLVVVGQAPLREGMRLVAAHLDSPRLDLRIRPLKTAEQLMLLKAEPYGGIKRYQWTNLPLALVGQVARADGQLVEVELGLKPGEPVFVMPDLAPHVDKEQRKRTADEVFKGEELNVVAGSLPNAKGNVQAAFMELLKTRYGLHEEDFVSAELSLVPAQEPREVGLDGALIGSYGQDDALCSFAATRALSQLTGVPARTGIVLLVDHEEVGNTNTTGVRSRFFTSTLERWLAREGGGSLSTVLEHSEAVSADVSQAINPNFPGTEDLQTTARLGQGLALKGMRPGFSPSPAFRARVRKWLTEARIPWQTYAYKVDGGGGSTIGGDLQELDMDVLDMGVPLLAMHGTFELCSRADLHAFTRFCRVFYAQP